MRMIIESIEGEYRRYRSLGERAMAQLSEPELATRLGGNGNSVATLAWHLGGNLRSRFTDFLTTDGEKPWRERETEFEARSPSREELLEFWLAGWGALEHALSGLADEDLARTVTIRGQELSVIQALHRSLAHASYHVGQMLFLGKHLRGSDWQYASIPPGGSADYNQNPGMEKPHGNS